MIAQSVRLNGTPLDVADVFRLHRQRHPAAWVFTSATLAVGESFAHFQQQLGLDDAETRIWDSPFDYPNQALWYVPRGMPEPNDPGYTKAVVELALPIVEASRGRAFLLFTSHRALREAAERLAGRTTFPLLVQGSAPKADCWSDSSNTATPCYLAVRVSGKVSTYAERRCHWSSSTSCRSRRRATRCCRRGWMRSADGAATRSCRIRCRRPPSR